MIMPEHMTVWDRNKRLYETLMGMGLHIEVVLCRDDPTKIDQIIVATAPPTVVLQAAEQPAQSGGPAQTGVNVPVEGAHVVDGVGAAPSQGDNVILLPTKL